MSIMLLQYERHDRLAPSTLNGRAAKSLATPLEKFGGYWGINTMRPNLILNS